MDDLLEVNAADGPQVRIPSFVGRRLLHMDEVVSISDSILGRQPVVT